MTSHPFTILALDGGGAKGFYTLGILDELEKNTGKRHSELFNLIYGTSTGAIIAALLARGETVEEVLAIYREHVPDIMRSNRSSDRSTALQNLATVVFGNTQVAD